MSAAALALPRLARRAGRDLASGIFASPIDLASGLPRSQAANDTGENLAAYDEGTSESCYWTSKDPIRFDGGVNLYAYANNDPVNFVDRTGKHPEDGSEGGSADGHPWDAPGGGPGGGGKSGGGGASGKWGKAPCEDPDEGPKDDPNASCVDMYEACESMGGSCTKDKPGACNVWGESCCATCLGQCNAGNGYHPKCSSCGYSDPD